MQRLAEQLCVRFLKFTAPMNFTNECACPVRLDTAVEKTARITLSLCAGARARG